MLILTEENLSYNLDRIPDEVDDVRYCVLDCSSQRETDFYWLPLIFLESFNAPAVVLDMDHTKCKCRLIGQYLSVTITTQTWKLCH